MVRFDMRYQIHLLTPMHVGTGMGFAKMIDDLVVRAGPAKGDGNRLPCIPGSAVKGKVRSRCEAVAHTLGLRVCASPGQGERRCKHRLCVICRLFGSAYALGPLRFSDALLLREWRMVGAQLGGDRAIGLGASDRFALTAVRAGNKIERAVHTVEADFLFSLEHTADELQFAGSISGQIDPAPVGELELVLPLEAWLLLIGLRAVDKIGGLRSRGLGRCRVSITSVKADDNELATDLYSLLAQEDYLLGVADYEA